MLYQYLLTAVIKLISKQYLIMLDGKRGEVVRTMPDYRVCITFKRELSFEFTKALF